MRLALFDLDHTLLPIDSDHAWGEYTVQRGWRDPVAFKARNDAFYENYKIGKLDPVEYLMFATEAIRQRGATESIALRADYMTAVVEKHIKKPALDLLEKHRAAGDEVLMVTATNEFVTEPIAKRFGIEHLIAVQLEVGADGWYTGRSRGTPSYQAGKVERVRQWLSERGKTWADVSHSTFYSDSMNDLPLLEHVTEPVATNPDPRLRTLATERGWKIIDLFQ
ncbi:HAD family hydrolase [Variovorax sp. PCZ-1]|uniref:histidinol-phosphatase n=1 Tax=Variovorax sp. PCZ-1 TaxID=2835533 RepID=UPI001BCB034B|nr:HAD family hydrolase [Variovorax sp. PCZ-1]MBS7808689.1 HAD family hydrolase [Variovorax sp. PCZ-1]